MISAHRRRHHAVHSSPAEPLDKTGYIAFWAFDKDDGTAWPQMVGYFFSDGAAAYVERETAAWKDWLAGLTVHAR